MSLVRKISDDFYYVGGSDIRISLFENHFSTPSGMAYNSYLLLDEKTVLFDTVDKSIAKEFLANLASVLKNRKLDYLVIDHLEPDHSEEIEDVMLRYPEIKLVVNPVSLKMLNLFMQKDMKDSVILINSDSSFSTGKHVFKFIMAPFVHWPEVMVTYDITSKTLFSADAFGTYGINPGNIFADEIDDHNVFFEEMRRYYSNIIGKYGPQVQNLLKSLDCFDIQMVCPLHGPIWRKDICQIFEKYNLWSTYQPESNDVDIIFATMYGHTYDACMDLALRMAEKGLKNIKMFDVSKTNPSYLISEAFRVKTIVLAAPTYNTDIYPAMESFIRDIVARKLMNRNFAIIENGSWAPTSGMKMKNLLANLKNTTILEPSIKLNMRINDENQETEIDALANNIVRSSINDKK